MTLEAQGKFCGAGLLGLRAEHCPLSVNVNFDPCIIKLTLTYWHIIPDEQQRWAPEGSEIVPTVISGFERYLFRTHNPKPIIAVVRIIPILYQS